MIKNLLSFVTILIALTANVEAQDPKAWLKRVSTAPPGPHKKLRPMKVDYGLSWKGKINAGKMSFTITEPRSGVYLSHASGKSTGIARALFPYDFGGTAQTNAETLKPLAFNFNDKLKTKSYKYSLLFEPNQMISQTDLKDLKSGQVTPYRRVYRFDKDVGLDLMSSILYLRSQSLKRGDKYSLITATFNKPYLTEFTVLGREKKTLKGRQKYNAIKMDVKISKIHSNMTAERYSKIEKATIWLSDDAYRIPIEFQGDIFIGYISAKMTSRKFL